MFLKSCTTLFKLNGFEKKGETHFYKTLGNDILLVFGFYHSKYGSYYYIEYGFAIKSINQHMPYPRFNYLNIRCGRIGVCNTNTFEYEVIDENFLEEIKSAIQNEIDFLDECKTTDDIKEKIIKPNKYSYIVDYNMQDYFGGIIPETSLVPEENQYKNKKPPKTT